MSDNFEFELKESPTEELQLANTCYGLQDACILQVVQDGESILCEVYFLMHTLRRWVNELLEYFIYYYTLGQPRYEFAEGNVDRRYDHPGL